MEAIVEHVGNAGGPVLAIMDRIARWRRPTAANLAEALSLPITAADVANATRFGDDNYVRHRLARSDSAELRLLCWKPGQQSALHAHGESACAFRILSGQATEVVLGKRDRRWSVGDVVTTEGPDTVHQMGNSGDEPLVTLHAYSPEIPVSEPSSPEGRRVVIVGGGFSGVATAFHLLRNGGNIRIFIVDPGPRIGRGVAYGGDSSLFRLNVPAFRMGLDPDDAQDFFAWARQHHGATTWHGFLPRSLYGRYMEARFADAVRGSMGKVRIIRAHAVGLSETGVRLDNGRELRADQVIVATGNEAPARPGWMSKSLETDPRVIRNPWDESALGQIAPDARVLVVGTGLTAIDVLLHLRTSGHRGKVTAISRHGLLPRPHLPGAVWGGARPMIDPNAPLPTTAMGIVTWARAEMAKAEEAGIPWQAVFDEIRLHTQRLWTGLSAEERRLFVAKVRPYWEVLRHRAPADALESLATWADEGGFSLGRGAVVRCEEDSAGVRVTWKHAGESHGDVFDAVVICTGPSTNLAASPNPFLRSLLDEGHGQADDLALGLLTDEAGRLIKKSGAHSPPIFVVGALRRPDTWESTSVPDLAVQAARMGRLLTLD